MDDVLVLRSFGLASCASMVIFNLCRKPPVMLPVYFNVLFIAVNGYFIARIVDERRDVESVGDAAPCGIRHCPTRAYRGRPCRRWSRRAT